MNKGMGKKGKGFYTHAGMLGFKNTMWPLGKDANFSNGVQQVHTING